MGPRSRIGTTLALAATIAVAASASASAACPGESVAASAQSEAALEDSVLCLVNEQRAAAGLGAVTPNSKLRAAAGRHSADMVSSGYFAHTTPGGVSFIDRIVDTGYTQNVRSWLVGENLVWGAGRLSSPGELVRAWMESPPHRENLLRGRFREIGIAAVRGTPYQAGETAGVTVSSEYGFRAQRAKKGKRAKKKGSRAARRAKRAKAARRAKARRHANR
jgi:uncharacterized protein YkwD